MRLATATLGAVLILFAAAGCDLQLPDMPMVGEEAGGNVGDPASTPQAGGADAEPPPGDAPPIWALPLSIGPVGLLIIIVIIIGALLANRSAKARGRKRG